MRDYVLNRAISLEAVETSPLRRLLKNWLARRAIKKLDSVDDYLLRDIGVTREDVRWARTLPLRLNAAVSLEERSIARRRNARAKPDDARVISCRN
jgi:uncharacterized protein YjiS (DUF1127 family)